MQVWGSLSNAIIIIIIIIITVKFHWEWPFDIVIWAKERKLPTDMNQSKVYFIISYFHIFKHNNSSLSILKVSNFII
jgi:hypothetical protein